MNTSIAIMTAELILKLVEVLNRPLGYETLLSSTGFLENSANRTMSAKHSRNTMPIRSMKGMPGSRYLNITENTNVPTAAAIAPFAVARL